MCESNTNIMADLLACRVCLATDINLYNIYNYGLNTMFEDLTGITVSSKNAFCTVTIVVSV